LKIKPTKGGLIFTFVLTRENYKINTIDIISLLNRGHREKAITRDFLDID